MRWRRLWRWRFRQLRVWDGWLLAMLLVLLWQPLASLQAGFWLSFGAVAWLIWGLAGRLGGYSFWQLLWRPQWLLTLGLLPILLALGLPQSLSAPLANLLPEGARPNSVEWLLHFVYEHLNNCYGFKNLYRAKENYSPTEWVPGYYAWLPRVPTPAMFYAVVRVQNPQGMLAFARSVWQARRGARPQA